MNPVSLMLMWVVLGAVVGWGASLIVRANGTQGVLIDATFGALGGLSGGLVVTHFFASRLAEQTLMVSIAAASLGAALMIVVWRLLLLPQTVR
jgi:uncharacterized membrane protein YeaQ/YmgE (transglycosylase-associated protein family)